MSYTDLHWNRRTLHVMAGLVPAIHVFGLAPLLRRGCPRHKRVYARLQRAMRGHDESRVLRIGISDLPDVVFGRQQNTPPRPHGPSERLLFLIVTSTAPRRSDRSVLRSR